MDPNICVDSEYELRNVISPRNRESYARKVPAHVCVCVSVDVLCVVQSASMHAVYLYFHIKYTHPLVTMRVAVLINNGVKNRFYLKTQFK